MVGDNPGSGPDRPLTVIVVDDHVAVREGLANVLTSEGMRVTGQSGSAEAAYALVLRRRPDVTVMDVRLGHGSGIELTRRLLAAAPELKVLLYTGELVQPAMVDAVLATGARGIALKTGDARELGGAIRCVAAGEPYVDPALRRASHAGRTPPAEELSEREREILRLVGAGLSNEQIAEQLFLSPHTVRTHVRNSLQKLGVHTRAEAVLALERARPGLPGLDS
jgi:DNA-binding NarL/FixJ family response regulator